MSEDKFKQARGSLAFSQNLLDQLNPPMAPQQAPQSAPRPAQQPSESEPEPESPREDATEPNESEPVKEMTQTMVDKIEELAEEKQKLEDETNTTPDQ